MSILSGGRHLPTSPALGQVENALAPGFDQTAVLEQVADGVIITDSLGNIVFVNPAAESLHGVKMLGVSPDQYSETYHLLTEKGEPYPPEELPLARAVRRGETVLDARWRIQRPDGCIVRAIGSARPLVDPYGKQTGAVLTLRDDTARIEAEEAQRQNEKALEESRSRLLLAQRAARAVTWEWDLAVSEVLWNDVLTIRKLAGDDLEERTTLDTWVSRIHPEDRDGHLADAAAAIHAGRGAMVFRIIREGEIRWLEAQGQVSQRGDDGTPLKLAGITIDITDRIRAEEHQRLLINELNHRVKNTLAIVQSLAQQTFKGAATPEASDAFEGRLFALSTAHNQLTQKNWEAASLRQIISDAFAAVGAGAERSDLKGPDILLPPKAAVSLAMAVHELATNALKYGSLSGPEGRVDVHWRAKDKRLKLVWRERGGPGVVHPEKRGFGTRMIERALASELDGQVKIDFQAQGVVCSIDAPLPGGAT